MARQLNEKGYVVIPLLEDVASLRREMDTTMRKFPEFLNNMDATYSYEKNGKGVTKPMQFVGGGFSALGNPGSFHNPFVRKLRKWAMVGVLPLLDEVATISPYKYRLEQLIDRMMFRPAGEKASAESWHRDETPSAHKDDAIFGGWLNLDDTDQTYSCVPGTHRLVAGDHKELSKAKGFFTIPKVEHKDLKARSKQVRIPPGHVLIFYENMLHEVVSKARKDDSYRLFLAWRLTTQREPLFGSDMTLARLKTQAVIPLKSSQMPAMYPTIWWVNHHERLEAWCESSFPMYVMTMKERIKGIYSAEKDPKTGKRKLLRKEPEQLLLIPKVMPSLKELKLRLYPKYTPEELNMLRPYKKWDLLKPGTNEPIKMRMTKVAAVEPQAPPAPKAPKAGKKCEDSRKRPTGKDGRCVLPKSKKRKVTVASVAASGSVVVASERKVTVASVAGAVPPGPVVTAEVVKTCKDPKKQPIGKNGRCVLPKN